MRCQQHALSAQTLAGIRVITSGIRSLVYWGKVRRYSKPQDNIRQRCIVMGVKEPPPSRYASSFTPDVRIGPIVVACAGVSYPKVRVIERRKPALPKHKNNLCAGTIDSPAKLPLPNTDSLTLCDSCRSLNLVQLLRRLRKRRPGPRACSQGEPSCSRDSRWSSSGR